MDLERYLPGNDPKYLIDLLGTAKKVLQKKLKLNQKVQSVLRRLGKFYGPEEETLLYQLNRYLKVLQQFVDRFGKGPLILLRLPSRICIIGGHTDYLTDPRDYLLGHVLTFANSGRDMLVAIRSNKTGTFRLSSTDKHFADKKFTLSDFREELKELSLPRANDDCKTKTNREVLKNTRVSDFAKFWLAYLDLLEIERKARRKPEHSSQHWENYTKASVYCYLVRKAYRKKTSVLDTSLPGFDMLVCSDIPVAGGASSSSALVVASDAAVRLADEPQKIDRKFRMEGVKHTPLAEWYVGTRGGSMDQATITLGEPNTALRMSFGPFEIERIPLPIQGYKWVTIYTHPHGGGSQIETGYNERSAASLYIIKECIKEVLKNRTELSNKWEKIKRATQEKDLGVLQRYTPDMQKILNLLPSYLTLAEVRRLVPARVCEEMESRYSVLFAHHSQKRITIKKWALHHFTEIKRIFKTAQLLKEAHDSESQGDSEAVARKMAEVGKNITESGRSLRDNYGLSTPDLDRVMEVALATKGVLGTYIHGGGFGGTALVLVEEKAAGDLLKAQIEKYYHWRRKGHKEPTRDDIIVAWPGEGLSVVSLI